MFCPSLSKSKQTATLFSQEVSKQEEERKTKMKRKRRSRDRKKRKDFKSCFSVSTNICLPVFTVSFVYVFPKLDNVFLTRMNNASVENKHKEEKK